MIPYAVFSNSHFLDQPDTGVPAFRGKTDFRPGLDAKAVIHDTLTLDIALNPDFSQVESDDPQVTVNQRFEVVFPEKRPFFLENNSYFATPENLFFSRRIVDPEFGGRITGKLGHWNLGVLAIDDRAAGAATDPSDPNSGDRAAIGVVRVQREFGKSNVGVLITDREFAGSYNRVAALDTRLKLNDTWTFTGQVMSSQTRDLDGTSSGGPAYNFDLFHQNRKWLYDANFIDRSEGFHTDLGYVPRVNMRQAQQFFMRRFHPKSKRVLTIVPNISLLGNLDHQGVQQDWRVNPAFNMRDCRAAPIMGASINQIFERYQNINFRRHDANVFLHTEYFKRATFDFNYAAGNPHQLRSGARPLPVSGQWQRDAGGLHAAARGAPQDRRGLLPDPHADREGQRLHQSPHPHAHQLPVHARAFPAHDCGLQRGPRERVADRPAAPEAHHGRRAVDLPDPSWNGALRGVHGPAGKSGAVQRNGPPDQLSPPPPRPGSSSRKSATCSGSNTQLFHFHHTQSEPRP